MQRGERALQTLIFISRWLAAPFLIGLLGALILLLYRFFADLFELAIRISGLDWHDLVVGVLNLIDIALTGNLLLIVVFSGYENFVGRIKPDRQANMPAGLVDIDFGALKQRLLASITIIAAVDALAWYLDLEETTDLTKLGWAIAFPLMFVVALLMLAIADRLGRRSDKGVE